MDTISLLLGTWSVTRQLSDLRTGDEARFVGTATVQEARQGSDLDATYREDGELTLGERRSPASRRLSYRQRDDGVVDVLFADGRPFVDLDLRSGGWHAQHPCAPDSYLVETELVTPDSFVERWTVRGPEKAYDAVTRYARLG